MLSKLIRQLHLRNVAAQLGQESDYYVARTPKYSFSSSSSNCYSDSKNLKSGRVELVCGPMFSGKTTELIRRIRRFETSGKRVALIKHSADTRYDDLSTNNCEAVTHDRLSRFNAIPVTFLDDIISHPDVISSEVIGVDEGQFFSDLAPVCNTWALAGKTVIVAALDGDYTRKMFPSVRISRDIISVVRDMSIRVLYLVYFFALSNQCNLLTYR